MRVTLNGTLSITVEDETLFDGQPLPVSFVCDIGAEGVEFEQGKVRLNFRVPVELCVSEEEWSRAVGEVLARALQSSSP